MRFTNGSRIETFKEVFDWIAYDWDYPYSLKKDNNGFYINKLYIEPNYVVYKTECYELAPGLFEKVEALYKLLKED